MKQPSVNWPRHFKEAGYHQVAVISRDTNPTAKPGKMPFVPKRCIGLRPHEYVYREFNLAPADHCLVSWLRSLNPPDSFFITIGPLIGSVTLPRACARHSQ